MFDAKKIKEECLDLGPAFSHKKPLSKVLDEQEKDVLISLLLESVERTEWLEAEIQMRFDKVAAVEFAVSSIERLLCCKNASEDHVEEAFTELIYILEKSKQSIGTASKSMFYFLFRHAKRSFYQRNLTWQVRLLGAIVLLCDFRIGQIELNSYILQKIHSLSHSKKHRREYWMFQELYWSFLMRFYGKYEAAVYMLKNRDNPMLRRELIAQAMDEKQYHKALRYCQEAKLQHCGGEEYQEEWLFLCLELYVVLKDVAAVKAFTNTSGVSQYLHIHIQKRLAKLESEVYSQRLLGSGLGKQLRNVGTEREKQRASE